MQHHDPHHNRDESVHGGHAPVQVTKIDLSERTWAVIAVGCSMLAIGLAVLAMVLSQQSEREARLAQYDLQILRAKVEAAGIRTDDH
jgi:hypothetical protein